MMEYILCTMLLHTHVDGADIIFATMQGPLVKNPLGKCLGVIRRGSYQAAAEYSRWAYEPVSDIWTDIESDGDSNVYGSSDEERKYQDNLYDQ